MADLHDTLAPIMEPVTDWWEGGEPWAGPGNDDYRQALSLEARDLDADGVERLADALKRAACVMRGGSCMERTPAQCDTEDTDQGEVQAHCPSYKLEGRAAQGSPATLASILAQLRDTGPGLSVSECVSAVRVAVPALERAMRRMRKRREYMLAFLGPALDTLRDAHRLGHDVPDDVLALIYDAERRGLFFQPGTLNASSPAPR